MTTTLTPTAGKLSAVDAAGIVRTRNGSTRMAYGLTAVIPGKGVSRRGGALIAWYPTFAAAAAQADKVNAGHDASDPQSWSDGRVTVAVPTYVDAAGRVDRDAVRLAAWLAAENVALWFAAVDAPQPRGRTASRRSRRWSRTSGARRR